MNAINKLAIIGGSTPHGASSSAPRQFLTFRLGPQEYGLDVRYVQTLLHYRSLNRVADGGELVKGVAIADGSVMPLVDMRIPFQCGPMPGELFAAVIILNLPGRRIGMVVDDVHELVALSADAIGALPQDCADLRRNYLIGVATLGQRSLILLDVDQLMRAAPADAPEKRAA